MQNDRLEEVPSPANCRVISAWWTVRSGEGWDVERWWGWGGAGEAKLGNHM